jgi:c-di-AMP phosphodiesterase-like protein
MNENKWHNRIMHLTSFSLGIVTTALMISKGWLSEFIYVLLGSLVIIFISLAYNYVRAIDYMQEHHPDYKGEDLFDEDEDKEKNKL